MLSDFDVLYLRKLFARLRLLTYCTLFQQKGFLAALAAALCLMDRKQSICQSQASNSGRCAIDHAYLGWRKIAGLSLGKLSGKSQQDWGCAVEGVTELFLCGGWVHPQHSHPARICENCICFLVCRRSEGRASLSADREMRHSCNPCKGRWPNEGPR